MSDPPAGLASEPVPAGLSPGLEKDQRLNALKQSLGDDLDPGDTAWDLQLTLQCGSQKSPGTVLL